MKNEFKKTLKIFAIILFVVFIFWFLFGLSWELDVPSSGGVDIVRHIIDSLRMTFGPFSLLIWFLISALFGGLFRRNTN